jgi:hypothetical protein
MRLCFYDGVTIMSTTATEPEASLEAVPVEEPSAMFTVTSTIGNRKREAGPDIDIPHYARRTLSEHVAFVSRYLPDQRARQSSWGHA